MANCFARTNIEGLYKSELRTRQRKPGESLLELGQAIRKLVTLVYPKAPKEVLDTLAMDSFLNPLTKFEVCLKILRARPVFFDGTLQITVEFDACMKAEVKRTGKLNKAKLSLKPCVNKMMAEMQKSGNLSLKFSS